MIGFDLRIMFIDSIYFALLLLSLVIASMLVKNTR